MPGWAIALLVLAAVVFLVIGPLAALAIHGMNKFMRAAKQAEARNSLGQMSRDAVMVYEREGSSADAGPTGHRVCPSASRPVPQQSALISGKKYMAGDAEWTVDREQNAGFACLGFSLSSPQYYQYDYKATADSFTAIARGDVDGDGEYAEFRLGGHVVDGELKIDARTEETNPDE